ncbi:hypothetical protein [Candidatus Nitrospira neomarina]|uniref:Uncharacterized protein n=1 Tax=Candidatus Nitrospira neomarina TaxID=3020899 RepID=A0AA96GQA2_9BACT|nr:hypothetical protein [Candidatus Nitrospira neomarina]WNM63378.1 hypothetical protein PQG83_06390 [Candidatus Nitrospira neomarina]
MEFPRKWKKRRKDSEGKKEAGVRPGSRGPFVSAKGPKTIAAPSGLIEEEGR